MYFLSLTICHSSTRTVRIMSKELQTVSRHMGDKDCVASALLPSYEGTCILRLLELFEGLCLPSALPVRRARTKLCFSSYFDVFAMRFASGVSSVAGFGLRARANGLGNHTGEPRPHLQDQSSPTFQRPLTATASNRRAI